VKGDLANPQMFTAIIDVGYQDFLEVAKPRNRKDHQCAARGHVFTGPCILPQRRSAEDENEQT